MPAWEPIAITSKNAVDVEGDQVRVEWVLTRRPDIDWAREFRGASSVRTGTKAFQEMPEPDVRLAGTILWTVPADDLHGAVRYVRACVEHANTAYLEVLAHREEDRRRREEEDRAKVARLEAAQRALNELD
jgi:hypothetical protein